MQGRGQGRGREAGSQRWHSHGRPKAGCVSPFRRPAPRCAERRALGSQQGPHPGSAHTRTPSLHQPPGPRPAAARSGFHRAHGCCTICSTAAALGPVPSASGPASPVWAAGRDAGTCPAALSMWPGALGEQVWWAQRGDLKLCNAAGRMVPPLLGRAWDGAER